VDVRERRKAFARTRR